MQVGKTYLIKSKSALYQGYVTITRIDTHGEIWARLKTGEEVRVEESWFR